MRGVNGASAAENRGYPGGGGGITNIMGSYGSGGTTTAGNGATNGSSGGTVVTGSGGMNPNGGGGMAGGGLMGSGPELKHHADFLTRLLAATPSYMSEIGNPPPGFFSDWLRRLVSKPSGNSPPSPAIQQQQQQSPPLSYPGQGETNGASQLDAHIIPNKRRKRSRINDQSPHTPGKDSAPSPPASSASSATPGSGGSVTTVNSGNASAAAAAAAALSNNPFAAAAAAAAHPLWFFPPFLPNPYMNSMNMNIPGLSPSAAAAASYLSHASSADLFRADNLLSSLHGSHPFPPGLDPSAALSERERILANNFRNSTSPSGMGKTPVSSASAAAQLQFPHHHHLQQQLQSHHLGHPGMLHHPGLDPSAYPGLHPHLRGRESSVEKEMGVGGGQNHHNVTGGGRKNGGDSGTGGASNKKEKKSGSSSSSFSISRLTSPSPSSNSSGGSGGTLLVSGGGQPLTSTAASRLLQHHLESTPGRPSSNCGDEKLFKGEAGVVGTGAGGKQHRSSVPPPSSKASSPPAKGNSSEDPGLCVDLRVSGRIWESSACTSAPRSIYKPLSAFHEPTDVNLYNSSPPSSHQLRASSGGGSGTTTSTSVSSATAATPPASSSSITIPLPGSNNTTTPSSSAPPTQSALLSSLSSSPTNGTGTTSYGAHHNHQLHSHFLSQHLHHPLPPQYESLDYSQQKHHRLPPSASALSTRYILRNLQQIYQRLRPSHANKQQRPPSNKQNTGSFPVKPASSKHPAESGCLITPSNKHLEELGDDRRVGGVGVKHPARKNNLHQPHSLLLHNNNRSGNVSHFNEIPSSRPASRNTTTAASPNVVKTEPNSMSPNAPSILLAGGAPQVKDENNYNTYSNSCEHQISPAMSPLTRPPSNSSAPPLTLPSSSHSPSKLRRSNSSSSNNNEESKMLGEEDACLSNPKITENLNNNTIHNNNNNNNNKTKVKPSRKPFNSTSSSSSSSSDQDTDDDIQINTQPANDITNLNVNDDSNDGNSRHSSLEEDRPKASTPSFKINSFNGNETPSSRRNEDDDDEDHDVNILSDENDQDSRD